jgi:outer membrane murein-binding lipoprotein Lpp
MTTITATITAKLLDGINDPDGLKIVLQEYSHSKGPLYIALADATSVLTKKLAATALQYQEQGAKIQERQQLLQETNQKLHTLDQQITTQSGKLTSLEHKVQENSALLDQVKNLNGIGFGLGELEKLHHLLVDNIPVGGKPQEAIAHFFKFVPLYPHLSEIDSTIQQNEQKLASLDGKVQAKQALVDEIKTIGGLGLGMKELVKLHGLLVKIGDSQGMEAHETIKMFFDYTGKFQDAIELDNKIQQLQTATATALAETEHWQAEAKAAETITKVRKSSIDITEKILAHGVKERDLPKWMNVLEKSSISIEELSQELDEFASLEKLCHHRRDKADKLEASIQALTAQVNALKDERDQVSAAITAVRDKALAEVEVTSQITRDNLKKLMDEAENYKKLQQETAELGEVVKLARLIKWQDPALWSQIHADTIRLLVSDLMLWCKVNSSHNPNMETSTSNWLLYPSLYKASLLEVLTWIYRSL